MLEDIVTEIVEIKKMKVQNLVIMEKNMDLIVNVWNLLLKETEQIVSHKNVWKGHVMLINQQLHLRLDHNKLFVIKETLDNSYQFLLGLIREKLNVTVQKNYVKMSILYVQIIVEVMVFVIWENANV